MSRPSCTIPSYIPWILASVFFAYEFILRLLPGVLQLPLMEQMGMNHTQFAMFSTSMFAVIYGLMQMPAGLLIQQFGLKRTLSFACFICALSCFGLSITFSFYLAMLFRAMTALGASFGLIAALISIYDHIDTKESPLLIGISMFLATISPTMIMNLFEPTFQVLESSTIFQLFGIIGLLLMLLCYYFIRENPSPPPKLNTQAHWRKIGNLLSRSDIYPIILCSAMLYFPIEYLSENEGQLLFQLQGYNHATSIHMIGYLWLGYAIGAPTLGWLCRLIDPVRLIIIGCITSIVLLFILIYTNTPSQIGTGLTALLGFGISAQALCYEILSKKSPPEFRSMVLAFNNAALSAVLALVAPIIGRQLDSSQELFSLQTYQTAMLPLPIMLCLALILYIWSQPRKQDAISSYRSPNSLNRSVR